ncbi:MAG: hypothetical protein RMA76_01145 [Deltaproteobacteria bacterium]|jgi:hypothetical protein
MLKTKGSWVILLGLAACAPTVEESALTHDEVAAVEAACTDGCENQSDTEVAGGNGTAIGATKAAAVAAGIANAEEAAKTEARNRLSVPECKGDCKQIGGVHPEADVIAGTSTCTAIYEAWDEPRDRDRNANNVSDFWEDACNRMENRNIMDRCDLEATQDAKPWYARCSSHARATAVRVCVDNLCACAQMDSDMQLLCEAAFEEAEYTEASDFSQLGD